MFLLTLLIDLSNSSLFDWRGSLLMSDSLKSLSTFEGSLVLIRDGNIGGDGDPGTLLKSALLSVSDSKLLTLVVDLFLFFLFFLLFSL